MEEALLRRTQMKHIISGSCQFLRLFESLETSRVFGSEYSFIERNMNEVIK